MVRRTPPVTGQLTLDDCLPDWPVAEPKTRRQSAGVGYYPGPQSDLRGQRLRARRIVTIPTSGEYV